jgi:hypothetical protein
VSVRSILAAAVLVSLFEASQEEFKRFFRAEIAKWREVVKQANLKLD